MSQVQRDNNKIFVHGDLDDFHFLLAQVHHCVEKAGYADLVLDMSQCTSAFQNSMLSVCAQCQAYRKAGIEIDLIPPNDRRLFNLFKNANWGHLLDPRKFDPSTFRGHTRIPATQYSTGAEQQDAVDLRADFRTI